MNLIFAAYSWRKAWGMQFILLWCSAWLLQWTSKEQWAMLPIFPINSVQMSNYFCLICLKKEMQFSTCLFSWKKWKKGKEKKQHKGKEERKKYVCCRQPSNALPGHWVWTAGSFSGNWLCPGVFQELPELNCCGKYFPDTDHPFISTAAQCARDVPVILLPFAVLELGIGECLRLP